MIALIIMALIGGLLFETYVEFILSMMVFFAGLIYILTHKELCLKLLNLITRIKVLQKYKEGFLNTYHKLHIVL